MDEWLIWFFCVAWVLSIIWSYNIGHQKGVTIGEVRERLQWVAAKKDKEGEREDKK